ncbi:ArsR/SmtB family transcription factor [Nitratidesulfovibrio liaohensis]|uniref:ArsR/SmtB family transcription factor n=1 Tax=Nitratidesulfovibrio liaohensis TaxID=2604158 RepID=UPI00141FD556|nr:metalloregulator ArsR/SmtB family transcription factor [Nitratidesulfovibrio liaohensis]NHZ46338.1 winged helix-turn-helix transcriptional regulator [Nitratidesulfovibrio liaohensis]
MQMIEPQRTAAHRRLIEAQAEIFKALGHPSRLLMVEELTRGERCVCELQALVGSDVSTVSKHLSILKGAGVVRDEKRGANVYYSLVLGCVRSFLECTGRHIDQAAQDLSQDLARLAALRSGD